MSPVESQNKDIRYRTTIEDPQIKIRVPVEIKQSIENAARKNGRSKVAEILIRLAMSFKSESASKKEP